MEFGLAGKTAVVTGASKGIGREIARALHAEGVKLAIVGRNAHTLEQSLPYIGGGGQEPRAPEPGVEAPPIYIIEANLGLQAEVERAAHEAERRLGHVDFLVNNAAQVHTGAFFKMSDEELETAVKVKLLGYARMVRAFAPPMIARGSGAIVNIVGSTARTPAPDFIIGSMINAALANFTRGLARELARSGVRVNAISPGWTMTEWQRRFFEHEAWKHGMNLDQEIEQAARVIPTGHLVEMTEVATLALLLLSGRLPSLVGEELIVDGGTTAAI
jgi:NAD(P)-dependent dehydrogenase (short-subunit alcohol dehydrogenase family)